MLTNHASPFIQLFKREKKKKALEHFQWLKKVGAFMARSPCMLIGAPCCRPFLLPKPIKIIPRVVVRRASWTDMRAGVYTFTIAYFLARCWLRSVDVRTSVSWSLTWRLWRLSKTTQSIISSRRKVPFPCHLLSSSGGRSPSHRRAVSSVEVFLCPHHTPRFFNTP